MIKQTDMCPDIDLRVPIGTLIDKYGSGGLTHLELKLFHYQIRIYI